MTWQTKCHAIKLYQWHLNTMSSPFSPSPSSLSPLLQQKSPPPPPSTTSRRHHCQPLLLHLPTPSPLLLFFPFSLSPLHPLIQQKTTHPTHTTNRKQLTSWKLGENCERVTSIKPWLSGGNANVNDKIRTKINLLEKANPVSNVKAQ